MRGMIVLLLFGFTLRFSGAVLHLTSQRRPVSALGWLLCLTGAWMVAGAVGAWFPLWLALGPGVIGAFVDLRRQPPALRVGTDVLVIAVAGLFSIPPLRQDVLFTTAVVMGLVGGMADAVPGYASKRTQTAVLLLPLLVCLAVSAVHPAVVFQGVPEFGKIVLRSGPAAALYMGIVPAQTGERIVLDTGAVAWLERPTGQGPFPGAVFFHGAHRDGSKQAAACIIRRALVDAGFVVLSVDHPGYGESPAPNSQADLAAWDPLPTDLAALRMLRSMSDVNTLLVVGHSQGTGDALRLLGSEPNIDYVVLFGASLSAESNQYWYQRFHSDRRLRYDLSWEQYTEIRRRFYDRGRDAAALPLNHAPVLFVRFDIEHPNVVDTRDVLYNLIPGQKDTWDLHHSTHYFNAYGAEGLVIGDTRVTRLLASIFRALVSHQ